MLEPNNNSTPNFNENNRERLSPQQPLKSVESPNLGGGVSERTRLLEARKPIHSAIIKWMWRLTLGGLGMVALTFLLLSFSDLPTFEELENPSSNLASQIIGDNGSVYGRYYIENRVAVPFDSLPKVLVQALMATEDERFYEHSGVDFRALGRVAYGLVTLNPKGGGSTVSQQLAKLLYSDRDFSGMGKLRKSFNLAMVKFKEWITAVKLEKSYTKEEIISMYFNQFNFINGAYGISAASEIYFGKKPNKLKPEEAALLVGMLQNPSLFNPLKRPVRAKERRDIVLAQMLKNGYLDEKKCKYYQAQKIDLSHFKRDSHADGLATYFRMELRKEIQGILDKPEYRKADGEKYNIYKDGLKIYTTINPIMQQHAEDAMRQHMTELQKRFWTVWKGKDPWKWVDKNSKIDVKVREDALNHVVQETDRYQNLRSRYLDETIQKVESQVEGLILKDNDIETLMEFEAKGGTLAKLVSEKSMSAEKVAQFRQIMKTPEWSSVKKQWNTLQQAVNREFSKAVPMRVFAYNAQNEKDTIMSPLDSIKYLRMFMQIGSMAVDPLTGQIKAWVGGINHKYFQYDHVRTNRQVGSTFKPLVYATAIAQQGISPCFQVPDLPYTIHAGEGSFGLYKGWTPGNATGKYSGKNYNLKDALKESVNTVSVYLMKQLGTTAPVRGLANAMGIDSSARRNDGEYRLPKQPAICLGATDLSVLEMTGAYTTFANGGVYNGPTFITKIEDRNGRVIYQQPTEEHVALAPGANYVMVQMLKYVAQGAPGFDMKSEVGGKTGTTNDFVDGWFMGITPSLVVGTWVGGEDRWIKFDNIADGQGAKMARPFFAKFIKRLEADPKSGYDFNKRFKKPAGDIGIVIDCDQYQSQAAPKPTEEFNENKFEDK
jgi:penicillin-binding protein 1A